MRTCYLGGTEKPTWITQEYVNKCIADKTSQDKWRAKIGDWYFCRKKGQVMQITDEADYYSKGGTLPFNHGHWACDIYLPEPNLTS